MLPWSMIICNGTESGLTRALSKATQLWGLTFVPANSRDQLLDHMEQFAPGCAVVLSAPSLDAEVLTLTKEVRAVDHNCPIVILSGAISSEMAISAMRAGASDVLTQDAHTDAVLTTLQRIADHYGSSKRRAQHCDLVNGDRLIGRSAVMTDLRQQIAKISASDANVVITGESGTGKEVAAELIHHNSARRACPLVTMNCASIPDTLLESELFGYERGAFTGAAKAREGKLQFASGGTLFLDEVADMPLTSQAKLLRAIENRVIQRLGSNVDTRVNFRIVAATNKNLEVLTHEKKFREDLYFRLNVVRLKLPPLRERIEDIPELAEHILGGLTQERRDAVRLKSDLIRRLQRHDWPGNVRELRNVIEAILVYSSSSSIGLADVPANVQRTIRSKAIREDKRSQILSALNSTNWNRNKASQLLHCSRMTLYRDMIKYSISEQEI